MIMHLFWLTIVGLHDTGTIMFMITGHTKNVVDGAFGHIKRKLKSNDARTSSEIIDIVANSSDSVHGFSSAHVQRAPWRTLW